MSSIYLLPCACGESITIRTTQAGELVVCVACGKSITIPTMREIRQLEPAKAVSEGDRPLGKRGSWSLTQGVLFSSGLLIACIGLGIVSFFGWYQYAANKRVVKPELDQVIEQLNIAKDMSSIGLSQSWAIWSSQLRGTELGPRRTPRYLFFRELSSAYGKRVLGGLITMLVGGLLAGSAFLFAAPQRSG